MYKINLPIAGSDEVGTGDSFGPVVVACAIIEKKDLDLINSLNIKDSKELEDKDILNIGPKLIKSIKHSYVVLNNKAYNKAKEKYNLNEIKATLHNTCYIKIKEKHDMPKLCVIDDFCGKDKYFEYLNKNTEIKEIYKDVVLETKAENKYIAVAVASIIARYYFINDFDKLCNKYNMKLAKGSSNPIIEEQVKEIIKKYGKEELKNVAKLHFKNINKIISNN